MKIQSFIVLTPGGEGGVGTSSSSAGKSFVKTYVDEQLGVTTPLPRVTPVAKNTTLLPNITQTNYDTVATSNNGGKNYDNVATCYACWFEK